MRRHRWSVAGRLTGAASWAAVRAAVWAAVWASVVVAVVQALAMLVPALTTLPGGPVSGAVVVLAAVLAACWTTAGFAPATTAPVRAWRAGRGSQRGRAVPRHRDPDAAGRPRPRAPSMAALAA